MTRTVDLVIVGMTAAASAAAVEAARRGRCVLVVDKTTSRCHCRQFRQSLAADGLRERVSVLTGVEVVCVDGAQRVEVVLVRHVRTGRLIGINARAALVTTALPSGVIAPTLQHQLARSNSESVRCRNCVR